MKTIAKVSIMLLIGIAVFTCVFHYMESLYAHLEDSHFRFTLELDLYASAMKNAWVTSILMGVLFAFFSGVFLFSKRVKH